MSTHGVSRVRGVGTLAVFIATVFTGAWLVFWIQPLAGKIVLPVLGGSPAVWTTALAFFQAALLGGYAYAHALARWLGLRAQVVAHLGCLALAGLALPVATSTAWPADVAAPVPWLLGFLAGTVGAPFVVASATAPLAQRWFAETGHRHAADPYFLYAASNVGSIAVLLAYPFAIEPLLGVRAQAAAWAWGFAVLAVGVAGCGVAAALRRGGPVAVSDPVPRPRPHPAGSTGRERLAWLAYSAVPSCLLLGVTGHLSTDIASGPLLWAAPLALYLLSFVNAFARRPLIPHGPACRAMAWALVLLVVVLPWRGAAAVFLPLHLAVFFVVATACHLELARRRPEPARLTEFYLFVALGGLLGGAGVALVAPAVFDAVLEYPLGLVLAAALLPASRAARRMPQVSDAVVAVLVLAVVYGGVSLSAWLGWPQPLIAVAGVYAALAALVLSRQIRPLGFALGIAAFAAIAVVPPWPDDADGLWRGRSFFGVYHVEESADAGRRVRHGTTIHGGQILDADGRLLPTAYYTHASPVADALRVARARHERLSVGVVGLGTGALAHYRRDGDAWRYFEIDPLVAWLAVDSGYFGMLDAYDPQPSIILGDARLALAEEADDTFDVLVLDAFSSDAVPTHMLTREAVALYLQKIRPGGIAVLHVSNRYLDLASVVAAVALDIGCPAVFGTRSTSELQETDAAAAGSAWAAIARDPAAFEGLAPYWRPFEAADAGPLWRDDHASLVPVIRWRGN